VTLVEAVRGPGGGGLVLSLLALAGVAAARGFGRSFRALTARSREGGGAVAGLVAAGALLLEDPRVLAFRTGGRLGMRGAGALLGVAFVLSLGAGLLLAASALAREDAERARVLGRRALLLALGALALGAATEAMLLATRFPEALAAEGRALGFLLGGLLALSLGVVALLGEAPLEPGPSGDRELRIAVALAGACLLGAALSSWLREGTSLGGAVPWILPAAILGLAAREPGLGALVRRGAFLSALLYALV
jgi:hypothetical protein